MIKYKDLSGWLKVAMISAWIAGGINLVAFLIGFWDGLIYY